MKLLISSVIISFLFLVGCSGDYKMVQYQRDEKFFDNYKNSASEIDQAATKSALCPQSANSGRNSA